MSTPETAANGGEERLGVRRDSAQRLDVESLLGWCEGSDRRSFGSALVDGALTDDDFVHIQHEGSNRSVIRKYRTRDAAKAATGG
jgi:hypothetical protein